MVDASALVDVSMSMRHRVEFGVGFPFKFADHSDLDGGVVLHGVDVGI